MLFPFLRHRRAVHAIPRGLPQHLMRDIGLNPARKRPNPPFRHV